MDSNQQGISHIRFKGNGWKDFQTLHPKPGTVPAEDSFVSITPSVIE